MKISCMASTEKEFSESGKIRCEQPPPWNAKTTDASRFQVAQDDGMEKCPLSCAGKANTLNYPGCCEYDDKGFCYFRKTDLLTKGGGDQRAVLCKDLYVNSI